MGYKILGFIVWQGAKWYVRRRLPDRRLLAAGVVAVGVGVAVAQNARRSGS